MLDKRPILFLVLEQLLSGSFSLEYNGFCSVPIGLLSGLLNTLSFCFLEFDGLD